MLTKELERERIADFLKTYYKNRARDGEGITTFEQALDINTTVDICHSFTNNNNKFVAILDIITVEEYEKIKFVRLQNIRRWDAAALTFLFLLLLSTLIHVFDFQWFIYQSLVLKLSSAVIFGSLLYAFLYKLIQFFSRYRYIFVVDKMKGLTANERWVAIGDDWCDYSIESYYNELVLQCTKSGIGLVSVNDSQHIRLHITPARLDFLSQKINKIENKSANKIILFCFNIFKTGFKKPILAFQEKLKIRKTNYLKQLFLIVTCLLFWSILWYKEATHRPVTYLNEVAYWVEKEKQASQNMPEIFDNQGFVSDITASSALPASPKRKSKIALLKKELAAALPSDEFTEKGISPSSKVGLYLNLGKKLFVSYDCERIYSMGATIFVLENARFQSYAEAKKYLRQFDYQGFRGGVIWLGCLKMSNEYVVFFDEICTKRKESEMQKEKIIAEWKTKKIVKKNIIITEINLK